MEQVNRDEPYDAPQFSDQGIMERSALTNAQAEELYGHHQSPSIDDVVHTFLDNAKHRFGEESVELTTIHAILGNFRVGEISKRDALSSIALTLRNQEDLKQDLLNVLYHKDAKWGAGDFEFDQLVPQPCPQFLQPTHEPQLPSISSSWYSDHQAVQSINPAVLRGYGGPSNVRLEHFQEPIYTQRGDGSWQSIGRVPSSPILPILANYHFSPGPPVGHSTLFSPYTSTSYRAGVSPVYADFGSMPQHSQMLVDWGSADYDQEYATIASPTEDVSPDASPSVLGNPFAVPIGRPAIDMPPPLKKRRRRGSVAHVKDEQQRSEDMSKTPSLSTSPTTTTSQAAVTHQTKIKRPSIARAVQKRSEGGAFIHSLCGKGFASRSKVRKHHWGAKNDDLETKTGCWAKHKKPAVSWNEHPSCKEASPAPRAFTKASSRSTPKPKASDYKAPVVPAMLPSHNTIPAFQDLPQTVEQALTPCTPTQHNVEDMKRYHSHRLPSRGSFDSLLTAVNIASQIDTPESQGRNDSVVSHLDARAVAAGHYRQLKSARIETSRGYTEDGFAYGHYPMIPNGGLQLPLGRVLPSQHAGRDAYTSASCSPHGSSSNNGGMFIPLDRDRTRFESSNPPDPETKSRHV